MTCRGGCVVACDCQGVDGDGGSLHLQPRLGKSVRMAGGVGHAAPAGVALPDLRRVDVATLPRLHALKHLRTLLLAMELGKRVPDV